MAPPGGQQQSASDNSLDMLWICAALCIGVPLLWYFFHTHYMGWVVYSSLRNG